MLLRKYVSSGSLMVLNAQLYVSILFLTLWIINSYQPRSPYSLVELCEEQEIDTLNNHI